MAPWRPACDLRVPGGLERSAVRLDELPEPTCGQLAQERHHHHHAGLAIQQAYGTEAGLAQRFGVGKFSIRK